MTWHDILRQSGRTRDTRALKEANSRLSFFSRVVMTPQLACIVWEVHDSKGGLEKCFGPSGFPGTAEQSSSFGAVLGGLK